MLRCANSYHLKEISVNKLFCATILALGLSSSSFASSTTFAHGCYMNGQDVEEISSSTECQDQGGIWLSLIGRSDGFSLFCYGTSCMDFFYDS